MSRFRLAWLIPPALLLFGLLPVMGGRYFADDFEFVLDDPHGDVFGSFGMLHPYHLYRPLQLSVIAASQVLFGPTTLPVRVVSILCHLALIALILHALRSLSASRVVVAVTGLYLSISQLTPTAVGGNDTLSLVMGTLFGSLAVWWYRPAEHRGGARRIAPGLLALTLALLSKESSLGYVPILLVLSFHPGVRPGFPAPRESPIRKSLLALATVALAAGYLLYRASLGADGPRFGSGGAWQVGPNFVTNLFQLWIAALTPVSTVDIFRGVTLHHWGWPLAASIGLGVTIIVIGFGLGPERWGRAFGGAVLASCVVAPVLLLRHVSELYAYGLLPAAALLVGFGYGSAIADRRLLVRGIAAGSFLVFGVIQTGATRSKAAAMAHNGEVAAPLMEELVDRARQAPGRSTLLCLEPTDIPVQYSVYAMDGFRLTAPDAVRRLSHRPDLRIIHAEAGTAGTPIVPPPGAIWLTIRDGHIVTLPPGERLAAGTPLFLRSQSPDPCSPEGRYLSYGPIRSGQR